MPRVHFSTQRITCLAAAIALLAIGTAAATELYKWIDANGVVHYTDTPPPTSKGTAQHVHIDAVENSNAEATADAKPPANAKPAEKPESLPDTPENRKHLCDQAQSQIELLQSKFQVADASGQALDDKARAERVAQAQQAAASYCTGG
jgi:hypothetical protein